MRDLELILKPSFYYLTALFVLVAASLVIAATLSISIWYKLDLLFLIGLYGGVIVWQFGLLRANHSIIRLRRLSDGQWRIVSNKQSYEGILRGDSTVTTWVSVLRFNVKNKWWPMTCVVFPDSLEKDMYRKMLVSART